MTNLTNYTDKIGISNKLSGSPTKGVIVSNLPLIKSGDGVGPVSADKMSRNISNSHYNFNNARKENIQKTKLLFPHMDVNDASTMARYFNSPEYSDIISSSQTAALNSAGQTSDLHATIRNYQTTQNSRAARKSRDKIKNNNRIGNAKKELSGSEESFYRIIKEYCPTNIENPICKKFKNYQKQLLFDKTENIISDNNEVKTKIIREISLYNEQSISLIRLKELLATRIEELSESEKELNNLNTSIENNTRSNFYDRKNNNSAKELQIYLIFFYYQFFIFYLFISNFFPSENYTKIFPIILVILYLIFPLVLQFILIFISDLFSKIQQNLGIPPEKKHLINKNI